MTSPAKWQASNAVLHQLLAEWLTNQASSQEIQPYLAEQLLSHPFNVWANRVADETVASETSLSAVQERLQQVRSIAPTLNSLCQESLGWEACPLDLLWNLWLPLALQLARWRKELDHPLIQGILGGQGTGKTTLTKILAGILEQMDLRVCRLSIDDLYKTYAERQQLQQSDPRFRWRGPPGTHDVQLGLTLLQQLRQTNLLHQTNPLHQTNHPVEQQTPIAIPRFDKSLHHGAGDRTAPEFITGADIVLFEGWFVGVRPIAASAFETAPPPIISEADRAFAREINVRLQEYLPLWEQLDRLILLYPSDYHLSQQWRQQAEAEMIASGKSGMSAAEIREFVEYFWKSLHPALFIEPMRHDAELVDLVIEINADHYPERLYCPSN
jgi:D-glycerate 3-kinase